MMFRMIHTIWNRFWIMVRVCYSCLVTFSKFVKTTYKTNIDWIKKKLKHLCFSFCSQNCHNPTHAQYIRIPLSCTTKRNDSHVAITMIQRIGSRSHQTQTQHRKSSLLSNTFTTRYYIQINLSILNPFIL